MELSAQQNQAIDLIKNWFMSIRYSHNDKKLFILSGYAGTGKSTLISKIKDFLCVKRIAYVSYTGKASLVLKRYLLKHFYKSHNK